MDYKDLLNMFDDYDDIPEDILKMIAGEVSKSEVNPVIEKLVKFTYKNKNVFNSSGDVSINGKDFRFQILSVLVPSDEYVSFSSSNEKEGGGQYD